MAVGRFLVFLTVCSCAATICIASPARRQFGETTPSEPAGIRSEESWNTDDFDLDDDNDWLGEIVVSPSSNPKQPEYQEYQGDEDDEYRVGDSDNEVDNDADQEGRHEFLVPSEGSVPKAILQDDDETSGGPFKVRHTKKNSYTESLNSGNSVEDSDEDDEQFEFEKEEADDDSSETSENDDDVERRKDSDINVLLPRRQLQDDSEDVNIDDDDDSDLFDRTEEDSQVIYGDHVFLY